MELISSIFDTIHFLPAPEHTVHILLILMVVIWCAGRLAHYVKIPSILGEIVAGILIGPMVLGLLPESDVITVLAELGIFFIMFHSGLSSDFHELLKSSKLSFALALGAISSLLLLGIGVTYYLGYPFVTCLFLGTILSVTSFPIIARILKDLKLQNTKIGHAILGATVVDDIIGFALLSVVISLAKVGTLSFGAIAVVLFKVFIFFAGTLFIGLKILPHFSKILNTKGSKGFTFSLIIAFLFGYLAEIIGLHSILGAFLGGMFVREEITNKQIFDKIEDRYYGIAYSFLGPIAFAAIGMTISPSIFQENLSLILIILSTLLVGQWIGTGGMAWLYGKFTFRESTAIAAANAGRGVMEIIIAKIGYDTIVMINGSEQRLLSPDLFSAVVAVSVIVTFLSPMLVKWIIKPKELEKEPVQQRA